MEVKPEIYAFLTFSIYAEPGISLERGCTKNFHLPNDIDIFFHS